MPDWKHLVQERLAPLRLTATAESGLVEELTDHLEDRYRELRAGGASEEEAYRKVIAELDDMEPIRKGVQEDQRMPKYDAVPGGGASAGNFLLDLGRDLRYAVRNLRKSPLFVVFVVMTLALGIGANTTVFTVINTLILNPMPVQDPSSLAAIGAAKTDHLSKASAPLPLSYADLKDYRAGNQVFSSLAGYSSPQPVTWQSNTVAQGMFVELVTGNYFSTLGLTPARGRFFSRDEDVDPGIHPVAVMNHATWQGRFGGAADVVGRTLRVNGVAFTVIGIAPPQFIGVNAIFGPDLWIPATMAEQLMPNQMESVLRDRNKAILQGVGRLRPGASLSQADANMTAIATNLAREYPATNEGRTALVRPIQDIFFANTGSGSASVLFGSAVLLIVVAIVLLIACSNVANLLLARATARQQEMAVRLALGAGRPRLIRQLLTESVLLGSMSGLLGLLVGYAGLRLLFGMLPGSANFVAPKFDATVFVFALAISLATGLLFGAIPAVKASRANVAETLKEESRSTGRSRGKITLANALLVGQVAFSFLLLVTAALFLRSIERAYAMDPGFQTAHLGAFMSNPGQAGYRKPQAMAFYREVVQRVSRLPGVESASWSSNMPLWARAVNGLQVEGREQRSRTDKVTSVVSIVDDNYFGTAGVTLSHGREFTAMDRETSTPVAIINEKMARDFWPGGEAIGKRIQLPGEPRAREIVGIARTANYTAWGEPPQLCVYVPLEQSYSDIMVLYVRSKGDPQPLLMPVQREIAAAGPQILMNSARTGREIIDGGLFQARVGVGLLGVFGLLALGLASVGLYGNMAYSVSQRKREIGVRMALGAAQTSVLRLVLKQGMSLVLTGVCIGFVASIFVGRLLSRMLFGVSPSDPMSVAMAALVLSAVALLACYLPARRASRVDPLVALREG